MALSKETYLSGRFGQAGNVSFQIGSDRVTYTVADTCTVDEFLKAVDELQEIAAAIKG